MNNRFRKIKACIIMSVFIFSAIAIFAPTSSAGLLKLDASLQLSIKYPDNTTVFPNSGSISYDVIIEYHIMGVGANTVYFSPGQTCKIKLETRNVPEWANAVVGNPQIEVPISVEPQRVTTNIRISVDETAPGQQTKIIELFATAEKVYGIGGEVAEVTSGISQIEFTPAYTPILAPVVKGGNYMQIGPMDTANFEIELQNLANAKTEVVFAVSGLSEGWTASFPNTVTLDSTEDSGDKTTIVTISIQPLKGFGYHYEKQTIHFELTARYYSEAEGTRTRDWPVDLTVESRGFSTVGIEIPLIIILLIYMPYLIFSLAF